jgi:hypothetical protein
MREAELCADSWKPLIQRGARTHRFQYHCASAWETIYSLSTNQRPIQIQEELINQEKLPKERKTLLIRTISLATSAIRGSISRLELLAKKLATLPATKKRVSFEVKRPFPLHFVRTTRPLDGSGSQIYKRACNLVSELAQSPAKKSLLTNLKDEDAQCMVDFMNKVRNSCSLKWFIWTHTDLSHSEI